MTPVAAIVRFSHAWWPIALAAGVVPVAIAVWARRRGRFVGALAVGLQIAAVTLAGLAMGGPRVRLGHRSARPYLLLRDVSASVRAQRNAALPWSPDVARETFGFAAAVSSAGAAERGIDDETTNVGAALRLALARHEGLAGLVIQTDGQFHDRDWQPVAEALGRTGLKVIVVPMATPPAEARLADLSARRAAGGQVALRVTVRPNAHLERTLTVRRVGRAEALLSRQLKLLADRPATIRLTDRLDEGHAAVYRAELTPGDAFPENDSAEAAVLPTRQRVALIAAEGDASPLRALGGLSVTAIPPKRAPANVADWLDFSAVVVVDAGGEALDAARRAALAEYVRGGGGMVWIGAGPHREPADRDDPVNRVSALVANPYRRRPMDVTVVLDASGSMARVADDADASKRRIKFDVAIEAVLSLKRHVTADDTLTVITFSDTPRRVYDSGTERIDFAALSDALADVHPMGATDVMKAIELAAKPTRKPSDKRTRLVILVSDLMPTRPMDPPAAAKMLRAGGMNLAVVGTLPPGAAAPETAPLEQLAKQMNAPLVRRDRLTGLAGVFAGFLREHRGEAIRKGRFAVDAAGAAFGVSVAGMPPLDAYLPAGQQKDAEVLLRLGEDPLLGRRTVGLGRSVTLAVPIEPPYNVALRHSPWLAELCSAAVTWAMRREGDPRFQVTVDRAPPGLRIVARAADGNGPLNGLSLTSRLTRPADASAEARSVPMRQTAPGRYEAAAEAEPGPMGLVIQTQAARVVWREALAAQAPPEFSAIGENADNLRALAELTGGRIVRAADLAELTETWGLERLTPVWPVVLGLAIAIMLLEWILTRVWRRGP